MVWNGEGKKEFFDPGRIRTCNLLIRSQTRYPLRHWTGMTSEVGPVALGLVRPTLCSVGRKNKDNSTIRVSVV